MDAEGMQIGDSTCSVCFNEHGEKKRLADGSWMACDGLWMASDGKWPYMSAYLEFQHRVISC